MKKHLLKYLLIAIFVICFIISLLLYPLELKNTIPSTIIHDRNSVEIGEIINDNKTRHRPININDIPQFTKDVIIQLEDKNFYSNIGIDFSAIIRAFYNNIITSETIEGASTISTQVIRNSFWLNEKRTYIKKLKEFYLAIVLNTQYSKDDILEYYLNNIYFGYLNYGVRSASYYYFNKDIKNLTKAEQIGLLILPKNPSKYDPYTKEINFKNRFNKVVEYLNKEGLIDDKETLNIKSEILSLNYDHKNKSPYIIDYLKSDKYEKKESIITTLDYNLTKEIDTIAKNTIIPLAWKDVGDYGILITDRKTNELLVMIGGIDYYLDNGQVNSTLALRQPGSTIKPFTYLLSFKDLGYKPDTTLLDLPIQFNTNDGNTYSPKNYSLDYKGEVTIAEALSQSINIPAVKTLEQVGISRLLNFLKSLKITSLDKDIDYYGLALTLGVGEISLFELLQSYSIFSNDGYFCEINILTNKSCKQIIEKKYTDMIYDILINRYFKLAGFPINSNLDFEDKEVFVKTGTSRNFRDNWSIGFTKNYMIGVWVGNKDGTYMKGVSGATGAGEIFRNIVNYLEKEKYSPPKVIYEKNTSNYIKITNPLDNSKYKIDPTKPTDIQEIKLDYNTNLEHDKIEWYINNSLNENNFLKLKEGNIEIKLKLYKNNKVVGEDLTSIEVSK